MKSMRALFIYELRSHLPFTAVFMASLLILLFVHKLATRSWDYWGGEWATAGLVGCLAFLAPALLFFLSLRLWASEREQGTLTWMYARPVPASAIFLTRLLAVFNSWGIWLVLCLMFHFPSQLARAAFFSGPPAAWIEPPILWFTPAFFAIAAGTFGSALSRTLTHALGVSATGISCALGLLVLVTSVLPTVPLLLTWGQQRLVSIALFFLLWLSCSFLAAAWMACRSPLLGARLARRAWTSWGLFLTAGVIVCAALLLTALRPQRNEVWQLESLGKDMQLQLFYTFDLDPGNVFIPIIIDSEGQETALPAVKPGLFVSRQQGLIVLIALRYEGSTWQLIDRYGQTRNWQPPKGSERWRGIGWSPNGLHFAWTEEGFLHVMGPETEVVSHPSPVAGKAVLGEWIDDQHRHGICVKLVRQSVLAEEADLIVDMGIYGSRAVGFQEIDEHGRTVRFTLSFGFSEVLAAEQRWERLSVYSISYQKLLDR